MMPDASLTAVSARRVADTPMKYAPINCGIAGPLILRCVEDYLGGKRYPLELLVHYD